MRHKATEMNDKPVTIYQNNIASIFVEIGSKLSNILSGLKK